MVTALLGGAKRITAARIGGIAPSTFYDWYNKGHEQARGRFHDFSNAIDAAESECEQGLTTSIILESRHNGRLALDMLRARFPKKWPKETSKHEINARVNAGVDDSFAALADLIARRAGEHEEDPAARAAEPSAKD